MTMNNLLLGLVPERIRARANGYSFLLYDTSWTLDRNITINLADIHHYLSDGTLDGWICPYISRHLLSLNPLLACCRRYSRGER